jgi:hypothetical protein
VSKLEPFVPERFVLVGLGGVGGFVLRMLVPFLYGLGERATVLAVDGDRFEESNRSRQVFGRPGPKAVVLCEELAEVYGDRVNLIPVPDYVTPQRARGLIGERDIVFCQPDNHATRRVVERRCARLGEVALFMGGNEGVDDSSGGTYGSVQIYVRGAGEDRTNRPSAFHPELTRAGEALPTEQGCGAAMASAPQLLFTNVAVAVGLLGAFYNWRRAGLTYEEACFDIATAQGRGIRRALRPARGRSQEGSAAS